MKLSLILMGLVAFSPSPLAPQALAKERLALPVEKVANIRIHTPVPVDLSPDGQWLAYTTQNPGASRPIENTHRFYTPTGVPLTWGGGRMEVWVSNTKTGETLNLSGGHGSSWGPAWSPNGQRLAFYSDRSGKAGLWIWEKGTSQVRQVSDAIVRPYFWFEVVRWTPDSLRVLCKILPEGMTLAQAAMLIPVSGPRVPLKDGNEPSVLVLSSPTKSTPREEPIGKQPELGGVGFANTSLADLAIIDVENDTLRRIVRGVKPRWFSFSPNELFVAFTTIQGWESNSQQPVFGLQVYSMADDRSWIVGPNIRGSYGINVSWSPDGRRLSYLTSVPAGKVNVSLSPSPEANRVSALSEHILVSLMIVVLPCGM